MRTKQEIQEEIAAIRNLVPIGPFSGKTRMTINLILEELECGIDYTAEEFTEMEESHQMAVCDARAWKDGDTKVRPSTGWGDLVKCSVTL